MKKTSLKLTALLGLFLLPFTAFAEEPIQSLNKMSQAMRDLNYELAFVQTTPTNMDSFRYRHIKQGQKVYAQLVADSLIPFVLCQKTIFDINTLFS